MRLKLARSLVKNVVCESRFVDVRKDNVLLKTFLSLYCRLIDATYQTPKRRPKPSFS